jgi:hypothetical protein
MDKNLNLGTKCFPLILRSTTRVRTCVCVCVCVCLWADSAPDLALTVVKNELAVRPVAFVQVLHDVVRRGCK